MCKEINDELDALGVRRLDPDEIRAARGRLERARDITPEFEANRLRVRLELLRDVMQISECFKAIGWFSLVAKERAKA